MTHAAYGVFSHCGDIHLSALTLSAWSRSCYFWITWPLLIQLASTHLHPHLFSHTHTRSHSITQSLFMKAVMPVRAADVPGVWWYCALLLLMDSVCPCYRGTSPAMMHLLSAWVCSFLPLWVRSLPCRLLSGLLMSGICVSAVPSLLLGISTSADTLYRTDTVLHGERKKVEFVLIICIPDNVVCWDCAAGRFFWLTGSVARVFKLGVGQIEDTAGWYCGKSDQRASNLILGCRGFTWICAHIAPSTALLCLAG